MVFEVIKNGFLQRHVPTIRARYQAQRDAMRDALQVHLPPGCTWSAPVGGMFFWVELPKHIDATALLPQAVQAGMAYVPGSAFYPNGGHANTLRLSFVTAAPDRITAAVAALGRVLHAANPAASLTANPAANLSANRTKSPAAGPAANLAA